MPRVLEPATFAEAASALAGAAAEGNAVRIRGAGTKISWGGAAPEPAVELRTTALSRVVEHNVGDLTAVLEAGAALAPAQETFAAAGQMLALDPPLGHGSELVATIGGVIATGDSGPLRHRYGGPRDLVVGITVALSDGTIAQSGGKVIKNVAGYDLGKLFAGSFGTLGLILSVNVRLHPAPPATATALGSSPDPQKLAAASRTLAAAPLELEALDIAWRGGRGEVLARLGGAEASRRAERVTGMLAEAGLERVDIATEDEDIWARQRAAQRSSSAAIVRVGARPSALEEVLRATEACGGSLVGRSALGLSFVEVEPDAVGRLRELLGPAAFSVLQDAPPELRSQLDPWGDPGGPELELMKQVKARFDPLHACNRGVFVGGI
jgi:glycolate oxidase FAD binding subunit